MKFGIIQFPGSNCDHDCQYVIATVLKQPCEMIWHKNSSIGNVGCIVLPGGFSYGDYLRCGAMAAKSPIMNDVIRFAKQGGLVLGICNGFQILAEAGLLPGVLLRNKNLKFICKEVTMKLENHSIPFTRNIKKNNIMMPIAHGEGCYFATPDTLNELENHKQIVLRYENENPNGSLNNIAGICNKEKNVFGLMPHPERSNDGFQIFESLLC